MATGDARKKRVLDVVVAGVALAALAPFLALLAIATKLSSPGPVLYRQRRIGLGGATFEVLKLRTMVHAPGSDTDTITTANDARITPFGAFLRKLKLDELPQLINVLKGDMSLVGPRPDVPGYADRLEHDARRILEVRPGITGPATIAFRAEEELLARVPDHRAYNDQVIYPVKTRINLEYIDRWSVSRDLAYLLLTVVPAADRWLRLLPEVHPTLPPPGGGNGHGPAGEG
jgi:lipopolysaccharide/colanic/teichoic acid biosynthesis glycosyltransferase